ncbi:MAG: HAD family hydrolase [Planctomycetota bacterium]|jgi:HAD superfamily hydrolase (TIGR01509 family)
MPYPNAVVFDMDGLMFNTEAVYWHVGTELLGRRGCEFTEELNNVIMGRSPQPCFEEMIRWHGLDDSWEQLAVESEAIFDGLLDRHLAPMPGLIELLEALEGGTIPKAICTSSTRRLVSAILSRFDMQRRFQFTLTSEDITHCKPNPEIYLKAAERFALEPSRMLVLEDSQMGCQSAAAAGAFVVAVPTEHSRNQDFRTASLVIDSLADPKLYEAIGL